MLGHKDLRSTQVYTHFRPETIKEVVSVFDQEDRSANYLQVEKIERIDSFNLLKIW